MVRDSPVQVTVSIGIAFCPKHGKTIDALIEKANKAEHVAKTKGRNRVEVYFEDVAEHGIPAATSLLMLNNSSAILHFSSFVSFAHSR